MPNPDKPVLSSEDEEFLLHYAGGGQPAAAGRPTDWFWGVELLGRGYDIFGRLAGSTKQANVIELNIDEQHKAEAEVQLLIDQSLLLTRGNLASAFNIPPSEMKRSFLRPKKVYFNPLFAVDTVEEQSTSIRDQMSSWALKLGIKVGDEAGLFGAEAKFRYSSETASLSSYEHFSSVGVRRIYELALSDVEELPVSVKARQAIDSTDLPPAELFDRWGTHYLHKIIIGSDFVLSVAVDSSALSSSYDIFASLSAHYKGEGIAAGGDVETEFKNRIKDLMSHSIVTIKGRGVGDDQLQEIQKILSGGAAAAGAHNETGGNAPKPPAGNNAPFTVALAALREAWRNPVMIEIPEGGLRPIWNLCSDNERKNQLQAAFLPYAKEHGYNLESLGCLKPLYEFKWNLGSFFRFSSLAKMDQAKASEDRPPREAVSGDPRVRVAPKMGSEKWEPTNPGKPWGYVLAKSMPGATPLYAFKAGDGRWRYETEAWCEPLIEQGYWILASEDPVGYVYNPAPSGLKGVRKVHAFYPTKQGAAPRYRYSFDSADTLNGEWDLPKEGEVPARMLVPPPPPPPEKPWYEKIGEAVVAVGEAIAGVWRQAEGSGTQVVPASVKNPPFPKAGWFAPQKGVWSADEATKVQSGG